MRRPDELMDGAARGLSTRLASGLTRRSFLGRMGGAILALTGGGAVAAAVRPEKSEAFHFCGHLWTTGSCPNPLGMPRIDRHGYPLRPGDGRPIDNLGRVVNSAGYPIHAGGGRLRGPDGQPLPAAPRTRLCEEWVRERYGHHDQRRCVPGRLLLERQARLLRHVLRLGTAMLIETAVVAAALLAGVSGAWSP
jgi:hypothetical protein